MACCQTYGIEPISVSMKIEKKNPPSLVTLEGESRRCRPRSCYPLLLGWVVPCCYLIRRRGRRRVVVGDLWRGEEKSGCGWDSNRKERIRVHLLLPLDHIFFSKKKKSKWCYFDLVAYSSHTSPHLAISLPYPIISFLENFAGTCLGITHGISVPPPSLIYVLWQKCRIYALEAVT